MSQAGEIETPVGWKKVLGMALSSAQVFDPGSALMQVNCATCHLHQVCFIYSPVIQLDRFRITIVEGEPAVMAVLGGSQRLLIS